MKSNPQPDEICSVRKEPALIDPEAYDASEQRFAASLEETGSAAGNKALSEKDVAANPPLSQENATGSAPGVLDSVGQAPPSAAAPPQGPGEWRQEVAARLSRYRARRHPREPRYPSLQLKFDPESAWDSPSVSGEARSVGFLDGSAAAARVALNGWPADHPPTPIPDSTPQHENSARVIPFRRSVPTAPKPLEELAEPLQLFPRILEVPEVPPSPPALGGILIEPVAEESNPKRPGIEIPLQSSSVSRRLAAAALDLIVVISALFLFGYIFFQVTTVIPAPKQLAGMIALILALLWSGYQYLLLTYCGATPGVMLTKLRLGGFDGSPVPRRLRRWRALASILSTVSLGLGYAWCMLDEDQLCWHDRITRTHMAPR